MGKELCNLIDSANIKETLLVSRCHIYKSRFYKLSGGFCNIKGEKHEQYIMQPH